PVRRPRRPGVSKRVIEQVEGWGAFGRGGDQEPAAVGLDQGKCLPRREGDAIPHNESRLLPRTRYKPREQPTGQTADLHSRCDLGLFVGFDLASHGSRVILTARWVSTTSNS